MDRLCSAQYIYISQLIEIITCALPGDARSAARRRRGAERALLGAPAPPSLIRRGRPGPRERECVRECVCERECVCVLESVFVPRCGLAILSALRHRGGSQLCLTRHAGCAVQIQHLGSGQRPAHQLCEPKLTEVELGFSSGGALLQLANHDKSIQIHRAPSQHERSQANGIDYGRSQAP